MSKNYYVSGGFNVTCDVCSKKIKASDAKHRWDGFVVCPDDFEQRHPQDFVKARQDKILIPFSRPRPLDAFILPSLALQDMVVASDSDNFDSYMEVTSGNPYFLEDYILDTKAFEIYMIYRRQFDDLVDLTEVPSLVNTKALTDSISLSDSISIGSIYRTTLADSVAPSEAGSILHKDYVEADYFLEDYVATITTF